LLQHCNKLFSYRNFVTPVFTNPIAKLWGFFLLLKPIPALMLAHKKILLGISGSIAAYKAAILVRLLIKEGAAVKVIMTDSATRFITPLTLATLSKNPVYTHFEKEDTGEWNSHVALGLWADAMVIAPASGHTLGKCAQGICDNLLIATYLSARCPVFFAPAMDLDMYLHPATQSNLQKLESYGNHLIAAQHGELASGLVGTGRMAEPEHILAFLHSHFASQGELIGKTVLLTAGPTYEHLDPVRFIGNHSTGKMGFALATALAEKGAQVELVSGPTQLSISHPNIHLTSVTSAQDMYEACAKRLPQADIAVWAAAVADYRPAIWAEQKIKKKEAEMQLKLVKTIDIAATLGQQKKPGQLMVGFALETENEKANALSKLERKNLDLIVLNSLNDPGAGFGHDTNKITVIERNGQQHDFGLKSKATLAQDIALLIVRLIRENLPQQIP
jgi:phosphopantothenoylcysteine decarboxylase/phosphopantothenate--cysteine ligase